MKIILNELEENELIKTFSSYLDPICAEVPVENCMCCHCIQCLFKDIENLEVERVPIYEK